MDQLELRARAAIVTGAASGIGRALAFEAGRLGMTVGIADVDEAGLEATAETLRERQVKVLPMVVDVRSAEAVQRFAEACFARFPSIAAVFANAGIIRYNNALDMDLAEWNRVFDVNLHGVVHCVAAFLRKLHDRGEPAQFVMTGSQASFLAVPEIASYVATKHAIWGLADSLRVELGQAGSPVCVSMLAPPRVGTGIVAHTVQKVREQEGDVAADAFFCELPTPEWVAELTIRKAAAREFFILPNDDFKPMFKARIADLI